MRRASAIERPGSPDEPLRDDVSHECVRDMLALAAFKFEREGERCG
jgi:hypothetical protein